MLYEGYGPGGVAVLCEILTDNRNRTAGEIRKIFELADGKLGATGCVAWMFDRKGLFLVAGRQGGRGRAAGIGARSRRRRRQARRRQVRDHLRSRRLSATWPTALEAKGITPEVSEITRIPDFDGRSRRRDRPARC